MSTRWVCARLVLLCKACHDDADCGRMTLPRPISLEDMVNANLSPRFGVEQGVFGAVHSGLCFALLCGLIQA